MRYRAPGGGAFYNAGVLGGAGANTEPYTAAQVGAASRPNPSVGGGGQYSQNVDPRRAAYPDAGGLNDVPLPRDARSWRGRGWGGQATVVAGGWGTQTPSGAVGDNSVGWSGGTQTLVHRPEAGFDATQARVPHMPAIPDPRLISGEAAGSNAVPDPRRQWRSDAPAGYPLPDGPYAYPVEYLTQNQPVSGVGGGGMVPAEWMNKQTPDTWRPRAGSTGDDDYRPARRWMQPGGDRPFDKGMGQGGGTLVGNRHLIPPPLASTTLYYPDDVSGAVPAPGGGWMAPGMQPVGIQRNTVRLVPRAWDELLGNADSGDGSAEVSHSYRSKAWKAGGRG